MRISKAFDRIKRWMTENGAPLLAENLAPGATAAELAEVESLLGFALPTELREVWTLHDGQFHDHDGFVGPLELFSSKRVFDERESVMLEIDFLRGDPDAARRAGVSAAELASQQWVPFAGRNSDWLAVCGVSGAVFRCGKDAPETRRIAASITEWIEGYAGLVEAGEFTVRRGFGNHYLERRDRIPLARIKEELTRERARDARYRTETPMLKQVEDVLALAEPHPRRMRDVLERAAREAPELLPHALELLFGKVSDPRYLATGLQCVLDAITLTPDQWEKVRLGGELIENSAIRDVAAKKAALSRGAR